MRAAVLFLLSTLTTLGCGPAARPGPAAPEGEGPPEEVVEVPAVSPDEIDLGGLGFDKVPPPPTPEAVEANQIALKLHLGGDHYRARVGFGEALSLSPSFDIARFNLACVHAALGDHQAAATELRALVRRDLAEFGPRVETEEELDEFRRSRPGRELLAELEALYLVSERALDAGLPTVLHWVEPPRELTAKTQLAPYYLRAGVYLPDRRRFLPATPSIEGTSAALVCPEVRRAVVVVAGVFDFERFELTEAWETGKELLVFELPHRGNRPLRRRFPEQLAALSAQATALGARFQRHLLVADSGRWEVLSQPFEILTLAGVREDPDQTAFRGIVLRSGVPDGTLEQPVAASELRVGEAGLVGQGEPIPLAPGHGARSQVIPSPSGHRAVVLSETEACATADETARVVVDVVDLDARTATRLAEGRARALAVWARDGTLLVQVDAAGGVATLHVWPEAAEAAEAAPEGVLLRAPIAPEADCSE